ncbi:hypothetical protein [Salmonirosea aquatica]|uniref:DUF1080 domain-containing protein n=1 Tax=Salmonirosea aquatica TaxID=2654236 RepID=A0A7C9BHU3_9BACT|nr:hypothetical protein [Cytophagaceae bacterium SJW1-29]
MKNVILILGFCLMQGPIFSQKSKTSEVSLTAEQWEFKPDKVTFSQEQGVSHMHINPDAGKVVAKGLDFKSGTIEFDVKPNNMMTFYFRYQNAKETECFYLRMGRAGDSLATEGVQYAPYLDGVLMWDTYVEYQSNAAFAKNEWNHIKLVISDAQMRMYINSTGKPTLEVEHLAGNTERGTLGFEGDMVVRNLVVEPDVTGNLSSLPGMDPTANDPRYIRNWAVSDPIAIPEKVDFSFDLLPNPDTKWRTLATERRGLVNLIRTFGKNETRSIVWLKLKVKSARAQQKKMELGFVNDVWVFLNGQMAYLDKNLQGSPTEKPPGGRISVENTSFVLPLKEGDNTLLIGIANDAAWGWGAMARFENTTDIEVIPDPTFDSRYVKIPAKVLDAYMGTYAMPMPTGGSLILTKESGGLWLSSEGVFVIHTLLYPMSETRFFSSNFSLEFEFVGTGSSADKLIVYNEGKQIVELKRAE